MNGPQQTKDAISVAICHYLEDGDDEAGSTCGHCMQQLLVFLRVEKMVQWWHRLRRALRSGSRCHIIEPS